MTCTATTNQLINAYLALNSSQMRALLRATAHLSARTRFADPEDLLHEALARSIDGTRAWPLHVPLTVFLANAMKSIAHADRRRSASRLTNSENDECHLGHQLHRPGLDAVPSAEDMAIEAQESAAARVRVEAFQSALRDDSTASSVLLEWISGRSPEQIMRSLALSKGQYVAARRRIARKVAAWESEQDGRHSLLSETEPPQQRF